MAKKKVAKDAAPVAVEKVRTIAVTCLAVDGGSISPGQEFYCTPADKERMIDAGFVREPEEGE